MKILSKTTLRAFAISLMFVFSSIGGSVLLAPASAAPAPLSPAMANWTAGNGNAFNQAFNPQNIINASNAQYLGLSWIFPLPTYPAPLLSLQPSGGLGVDTSPLIINGTIYAVTQAQQAFALNAANGNVLWNTVLPILPNATAGMGNIGSLRIHLHDGDEQFTTKLFNHTPTWWISGNNWRVYALNALNGKILLNFTIFTGPQSVKGTCSICVYHHLGSSNILVDDNRGILISSEVSTNISDSGRCFYRGWDVTVTPPKMLWETYCTPPQSGSAIGPDPNWTINQVNSMKGAQIFYPGPQYNGGGTMPGTAVVDLKTLSTSQLNATLYDDWQQTYQTAACKAITGGMSTGSTGAGWGAPWLLGTGPTNGLMFVNTNNKDPYASPCDHGPDLWSASILALNETNGAWVWGFQANAHELWDYDCSWWQAMANETINGVNTQVILKTCKAGYEFELNAVTGKMIWAWTPPLSIEYRCGYCYMLNPLNRSQMTQEFFDPTTHSGVKGGQFGQDQPANYVNKGTLCSPCTFSFESESAFDPVNNLVFTVSQNAPSIWYMVSYNLTNYHVNGGTASFPVPGATGRSAYNDTAEAVNAATGQMVWSHFVNVQGYRGGMSVSGGVLYLTMPSGDLLMLNAKTGATIKDLFLGGPLNILPSIGATASGQMEIIVPESTGTGSWGSVPGNLLALTLQNLPIATTNTVTSTVSVAPLTTTATSTVTSVSTSISTAISTVSGGGIDPTTFYAVTALAAIFIIATGFFALRSRRKPAP